MSDCDCAARLAARVAALRAGLDAMPTRTGADRSRVREASLYSHGWEDAAGLLGWVDPAADPA